MAQALDPGRKIWNIQKGKSSHSCEAGRLPESLLITLVVLGEAECLNFLLMLNIWTISLFLLGAAKGKKHPTCLLERT